MNVGYCPDAAYGFHGLAGRDGRCPYCDTKVQPVQPKPKICEVSELTMAYRYHYDPDFGSQRTEDYVP